MIPWGATLRVHWNRGTPREHRLWIWVPLFLVWLILLPLVLVLFPFVALACAFLDMSAVRLYQVAWGIVSSLHRTWVEVKTGDFWIWVNVL